MWQKEIEKSSVKLHLDFHNSLILIRYHKAKTLTLVKEGLGSTNNVITYVEPTAPTVKQITFVNEALLSDMRACSKDMFTLLLQSGRHTQNDWIG